MYPDGYKKSWNDCRKEAGYPAKKKGIKDIRFLQDIVSTISENHDIKINSVFAFGYSNGGQLVNKIIMEEPGWLSGAAVVDFFKQFAI